MARKVTTIQMFKKVANEASKGKKGQISDRTLTDMLTMRRRKNIDEILKDRSF